MRLPVVEDLIPSCPYAYFYYYSRLEPLGNNGVLSALASPA